MPLIDGEGDMPLMDGDGDGDGDAALADGDVPGICMYIGAPPIPMLWWTPTHQFHTSVCTGPAT
jgi:hypothetical protein